MAQPVTIELQKSDNGTYRLPEPAPVPPFGAIYFKGARVATVTGFKIVCAVPSSDDLRRDFALFR